LESHGGTHCLAFEVAPDFKAQAEAKFHMYCFVCADELMKPHGSVRVVRKWCDVRTDPILGCFDNPEVLNYGDLLVGVVPKLESWLIV
jgi:hypothetical protein